jgi:hypothetical protein
MISTLLRAAALVAALMATPAAAESWRLAAANDGAVMFVDTDSQSQRGEAIYVTIMTVALPQTTGDWDQSIIRREIDCRNSRSAMLDRSFYERGRLISSTSTREAAVTHGPDTMMRGVLEAVCGYRTYESGPVADPYNAGLAVLRGTGARK